MKILKKKLQNPKSGLNKGRGNVGLSILKSKFHLLILKIGFTSLRYFQMNLWKNRVKSIFYVNIIPLKLSLDWYFFLISNLILIPPVILDEAEKCLQREREKNPPARTVQLKLLPLLHQNISNKSLVVYRTDTFGCWSSVEGNAC